jgi:hypothetical protein
MGRDVRFLRQAALLLPSAFLLDVLIFLLTHGRQDPGFGTYPFFQEWFGDAAAARPPETRFVQQALLFFLPAYALALLFLLGIALAERILFGARPKRAGSAFGSAFAAVYPILFLVATGATMWFGERMALAQAPGTLVAPLLAAAAPFAGAALAVAPAAILAGPVALARKASFA